jgi:hypothetical protein
MGGHPGRADGQPVFRTGKPHSQRILSGEKTLAEPRVDIASSGLGPWNRLAESGATASCFAGCTKKL